MNDDGDKYAFPKLPDEIRNGSYGMTLRDYFAASALSAIPDYMKPMQTDQRILIAEWAYGLADAMLRERNA